MRNPDHNNFIMSQLLHRDDDAKSMQHVRTAKDIRYSVTTVRSRNCIVLAQQRGLTVPCPLQKSSVHGTIPRLSHM